MMDQTLPVKTNITAAIMALALTLMVAAGCSQQAQTDTQSSFYTELQEDGFRPLFNGEDLSGWQIPENDGGHWRVVDGVIDYDALSEAEDDKSLYTEETFRDYVLYVDWKIKRVRPDSIPAVLPDGRYARNEEGEIMQFAHRNADSGIYLRGYPQQVQIWNWHIGSGELYGTRNDTSVPLEERKKATPSRHMDKPVGEWNRFRIELIGDRVNVDLNGYRVIEDGWLKGIAEEGPIGLQHHGGLMDDGSWSGRSSEMQFRNIWIKEL